MANMKFKIVEIEKVGIKIIPQDWITAHDQVHWHSDAVQHIKEGNPAKEKWKIYNVKEIDSRTFKSYKAANTALEEVKNSRTNYKIENIFIDDNAGATEENGRLQSSNSRNFTDLIDDSNIVYDESTFYDPLNTISVSKGDQECRPFEVINIPPLSQHNDAQVIIKEEEGITNASEKLCMIPVSFLNNLLAIVKSTQKDVQYIKLKLDEQSATVSDSSTQLLITNVPDFQCKKLLPCKDIAELHSLENFLEKNQGKHDFTNYLKTKLLNGQTLKQVTALFIEIVYSLELQGKVNYVGAKGKSPLKNLISTQVLIKELAEVAYASEKSDDRHAALKIALIEFRYQMQHSCDRIKSVQKRNSASKGPIPIRYKKLKLEES